LLRFLKEAKFVETDVRIVSRETESPYFQTVFATGVKG
jgi:hypothetical protein